MVFNAFVFVSCLTWSLYFALHFHRSSPDLLPLTWWSKNEESFPRLAILARCFLAILPTSAASERIWSQLKFVISKLSSTIDGDLACQIIYLKKNFLLFDKVFAEIAPPPDLDNPVAAPPPPALAAAAPPRAP